MDSPGDLAEEPESEYRYPAGEEPVAPFIPTRTTPGERFANIRRLVVFILGVAIIIDSLWDRQYVVPELIIGMIMVGVLPIDDFVTSMRSRRRRRGG